MSVRTPLVVILGATGSGKTKLSLEIAQKFGGEIVSADSMQVYKGLDIITAKATVEERSLIPHHLIDFLHPNQSCTVVDFRNKALPIINNLLSKNRLPVIVGGTNYYIESLLWKILIEEPGKRRAFEPGISSNNEHELPSAELHSRLLEIDPVRALQLHPNNKRKILRSLEVQRQMGRRHSELLQDQQTTEGGSCLGGGLRYLSSVIFWLQCDQDVLHNRLDARVDSMLEQGLVGELLDFHKKYNEHQGNTEPDYTKGNFQSIGFKEFHEYLILDDAERTCDKGRELLAKGIEELKLVTRRYARKQKRWINNRFLSKSRMAPPLYGLNATDASKWEENVKLPAFQIIECYRTGTSCDHQPLPQQDTHGSPNSQEDTYVCEVCERVFIGNHQWSSHLKSHRHKRVLGKKRKLESVKD